MPDRRAHLASFAVLAFLAALLVAPTAAEELTYYLPDAGDPAAYDPDVPRPSAVLGYEVGEWHVRPDQLNAYMRAVAESSARVAISVQGHTHEQRPQPLLTITSPENHARLDEIREQRRGLVDPRQPLSELEDLPVVIWLGYSIHGNEPSGANASMLLAYHLAASLSDVVAEQLEQAVILVDPSLNPDGIGRFAHWANTNRGMVLNADPAHREHREPWPGGRTNHYWFDLNRDWLLLQHPESRNRMATWKAWQPNLVGDFHEMGSDATFFFQPGVPSRRNPLIPERNVELTEAIAAHHAAVFDGAGRLYYTREGFDDFYLGKGSTYPDAHGAVGFLFEQARAAGRRLETANGELAFVFGIKNQLLASLSMVEGGVAKRLELLEHQRDFFRGALAAAEAEPSAYVFHLDGDRGRAHRMLDLLLRHEVEVYGTTEEMAVSGRVYPPGTSWLVPLAQPQSTLVRSFFETVTEFNDSVFYDVSAWTLPLAFGAEYDLLEGGAYRPELLGTAVTDAAVEPGAFRVPPRETSTYAYAFSWDGYFSARTLNRLQRAGARARAATASFTAETPDGPRAFEPGAIVVPVGRDAEPGANARVALEALFAEAAAADGVDVHRLISGQAAAGIDIGSPSLRPLVAPRPLLVTGRGVPAYRAGEAWHVLDERFGVEASLVDLGALGGVDLDRYTHVVLTLGGFGGGAPRDDVRDRLRNWVRSGGAVVAIGAASRWAGVELLGREAEVDETAAESEDAGASEAPERHRYADYRDQRAEQLMAGTIVGAELDLTHPLAYGYKRPALAVIRTGEWILPPSSDPFENVALYQDPPRLSGWISPENQRRLAGKPAVIASRMGRGVVIQLLDNPNFRAYFYGSNRLFLNSIFLSGLIDSTSAPDTW
ncbi:MAG: M14 family zinc carboxypeptidase [Acidobacteriota bacterium]|nr:M14 family zinc carboxypeptidase [Acidobacteriota bacterium]